MMMMLLLLLLMMMMIIMNAKDRFTCRPRTLRRTEASDVVVRMVVSDTTSRQLALPAPAGRTRTTT
jgi:hypothetical protein